MPAATVLNLPAEELEGVWESLVYEAGTKDTLLGHSDATLAFSDAKIDPNIVSANRSVPYRGSANDEPGRGVEC